MNNVTSSFIWSFLERFLVRIVSFIISLILARELAPECFGIISILEGIIEILAIFIDVGLGIALIQQKDTKEIDFSTTFYCNLIYAFIVYILIFFFAPHFSLFFRMDLTAPLRVIGLVLFSDSLKNIQMSFARKNMQFDKYFISSSFGTIIAAIISVYLAKNGYGVWALVFQTLVDSVIDSLVMLVVIDWKPRFEFSFQSIKKLLKFSGLLQISSIIEILYNSFRRLAIGKIYTSSDLAYYGKGSHYPGVLVTTVCQSLEPVIFSLGSSKQDEIEDIKKITKITIKLSTYIIMPMMFGFIACSEELIEFLYTKKWLPCLPYLNIFCIIYAFYSIGIANTNAIKSLGRIDYIVKIQIIKTINNIVWLIITLRRGPLMIAYGVLISTFINNLFLSFFTKKVINYSLHEQLIDILPQLLISVMMAYIVNLISVSNSNLFLYILIKILVGFISYIILSLLTKNKCLNYFYEKIGKMIKKNEK